MRKRYDGDLEAGDALLPDADDDELKVAKVKAATLPRGDAGRSPRVRAAWLVVFGWLPAAHSAQALPCAEYVPRQVWHALRAGVGSRPTPHALHATPSTLCVPVPQSRQLVRAVLGCLPAAQGTHATPSCETAPGAVQAKHPVRDGLSPWLGAQLPHLRPSAPYFVSGHSSQAVAARAAMGRCRTPHFRHAPPSVEYVPSAQGRQPDCRVFT